MENTTSTSVTCTINDRVYHVSKGSTILKACEQSGLLIPRFCYHDRLSIAGNCRMCLVQLDKALKPVASCALEILPGMRIFTNTSLVRKAREGVMEFLLANHPLDCPICDQGGECDLQDQALVFGNDRGRFYETKRAVVDKHWGHLIKTVMTRCIHCTRCQRFSSELSGQSEVLMVGRGNKSEISNFVAKLVQSEVSGNVIDLCPVGALTSKPYAFTARPWELTKITSIDLSDSLHSNLSYHINQQRILRVLPVLNAELNEEWLTDRARFSYDGYRVQRLTQPFTVVKTKVLSLTWYGFLEGLLFQAGPFFEFSSVLKEVSLSVGYTASKLISFSNVKSSLSDQRGDYLLSGKYAGIGDSDLVVLVGLNLKRELPLLAVRLRFEQTKRNLSIIQFGNYDLGLKVLEGGTTLLHFLSFVEGRHSLSPTFRKSLKPVVLFGAEMTNSAFKNLFLELNSNAMFGVVPSAGSLQTGLTEFGLSNKSGSFIKKTFCILFSNSLLHIGNVRSTQKAIFFGSHGFDSLVRPNFYICPISSSVEEESLCLNLEGRVQISRTVFSVPVPQTFNQILTKLIAVFGSLEQGWGLLSQILDLAINEVLPSSFFVKKKSVNAVDLLPFFSFVSSCYTTTMVTHVSPLLIESSLVEKRMEMSAFPLRF